MMKRCRFLLPVALVALGIAVPSSSSADENVFGECPDGYQPTPLFFAPEEDRNMNGIVCTKFVSSDGSQTHDDPNGQRYRCNGFPLPPAECVSDPDGEFWVLDDEI